MFFISLRYNDITLIQFRMCFGKLLRYHGPKWQNMLLIHDLIYQKILFIHWNLAKSSQCYLLSYLASLPNFSFFTKERLPFQTFWYVYLTFFASKAIIHSYPACLQNFGINVFILTRVRPEIWPTFDIRKITGYPAR